MNFGNIANNNFLKMCKRIVLFIGDVAAAVGRVIMRKLRQLHLGEKISQRIERLRQIRFADVKSFIVGLPAAAKAVSAAVLVLIAAWCVVGGYCSTHFLSGTTINGVDVSGMTVKQARQAVIDAGAGSEVMLIEKNGVTETVYGKDIGLEMSISDDFSHVLKRRSGYSWFAALTGKSSVDADKLISCTWDEAQFEDVVSQLDCVSPKTVSEPVDAELYFYGGEFKIRPEIPGNYVKKSTLSKRLQAAFAHREPTVSLESEKLYAMPPITSDNEQLLAKKSVFDKIAGMTITLTFGSSKEQIDAGTISQWLDISGSGNDVSFEINGGAVSEYVQSLAQQYDTISRPKSFKTHDGSVIEIGNSYYGWQLDTEYAAQQLAEIVSKGQSASIDLTDRSESSDKWWLSTAAAYDPMGYYGSTYAEVSIDGQYMWMYENGVVTLESDVVTGMPDSEHDTPVGIYKIIYKEQNATLRGEDYETEVAYWMVFTDDIGFHDAEWQYAFGDDMYLDNGSHGCVNLPIDIAEELYGKVYPGMPVFVY